MVSRRFQERRRHQRFGVLNPRGEHTIVMQDGLRVSEYAVLDVSVSGIRIHTEDSGLFEGAPVILDPDGGNIELEVVWCVPQVGCCDIEGVAPVLEYGLRCNNPNVDLTKYFLPNLKDLR